MKEIPFYIANGELSAYSFACGYVQDDDFPDGHVQLYREANTYHVRAFKNGARIVWDCFDTITPARKRYAEIIKEWE